jgi:hypothetical protein
MAAYNPVHQVSAYNHHPPPLPPHPHASHLSHPIPPPTSYLPPITPYVPLPSPLIPHPSNSHLSSLTPHPSPLSTHHSLLPPNPIVSTYFSHLRSISFTSTPSPSLLSWEHLFDLLTSTDLPSISLKMRTYNQVVSRM